MSGSFVISTSIATGETMSTRQNLQPAPRFESGNELAVTREAMEGQFVCVELAHAASGRLSEGRGCLWRPKIQ
jgi:hypothetical protein